MILGFEQRVGRSPGEDEQALAARLSTLFAELERSCDHHRRGYLLQDILNQLFALHGVRAYQSFTRNEGGEQIDGAFKFEGWFYLVECRWRGRLSDIADLDALAGKIQRSSKQTMGLFLSINGWSLHVAPLLRQSPHKSIILMDGADLRLVLDGLVDLSTLIDAKLAALSLDGDPHFPASQLLRMSDAA